MALFKQISYVWQKRRSGIHPWTGRDAMVLVLLTVLAYTLLFAFEIGRLGVYGLPLDLAHLDLRTSFNAWFWLFLPIMAGLTVLQLQRMRAADYAKRSPLTLPFLQRRRMRRYYRRAHWIGIVVFALLLTATLLGSGGWSIVTGVGVVLMIYVFIFKKAYNWADGHLQRTTRDRLMTFRQMYTVAYHDLPLIPTRCVAVLVLILLFGAYVDGRVYELVRTELYVTELSTDKQAASGPYKPKQPCLIIGNQDNQYLCSPYDPKTNVRGNDFRIREINSDETLHHLDTQFTKNGREMLWQLVEPPVTAVWNYLK